MIRILIEGMTEGKGGKEAYIINTFRAFNKDRYSFTFVAYDDTIAYQEELETAGAEIIKIPSRKNGVLKYRRALREVFQRKEYDVVWANKTTLSSCEILEIAKKSGVPLRIVHSHSSANMGGKFTLAMHNINKLFLRRWANEFFACSDTAAKWFFGNRTYQQIKNGIDVEKFRFNPSVRDHIRSELEIDDEIVVGHIGRFGIEKNHKKLINVFADIHKKNKNTKLVLCGDGEERHNIETQIKALNLEDSVLLLGVVNNVNEILQAIDVIVMPSLFEGLPFALLEAQAAGLKCVVSDTVSQESNILGRNVFISLDEDDYSWAKQVLTSITPSSEREHFADLIIQKGFDIFDSVEKVQSIIEDRLFT